MPTANGCNKALKSVFNLIHGDDFENLDPETKLREQFFFTMIDGHRKKAFGAIPSVPAQRMTENDQKNIIARVFKLANQDATEEINRIKSVALPGKLFSVFNGLSCIFFYNKTAYFRI